MRLLRMFVLMFALLTAMLSSASVAAATEIDELTADYSMLADAVERVEGELLDPEAELDTELVEAFGDRLVAINDLPPHESGGGHLPPAVPERVSAPSIWGDWAEFDFGDQYGIVRFRLVGRAAGVAGDVSGVSAFHERSWNGYGDSVILVSGREIEDFVVIPAASRTPLVELRYEFELPVGGRLEQRGTTVAIVGAQGVDLVVVEQPQVQDAAGSTFDALLGIDGDEMVVSFAAEAHSAVGDLLVDPLFGNPAVGEWTYRVCSTAGSTSCEVASNSFPPGWSHSTASENYRVQQSTSSYGTYIGVSATTIEYTNYPWMRWSAPSGSWIDRSTTDMTVNTANTKFKCRTEIGTNGVVAGSSAWNATDEASFGGTVNPSGRHSFAGFTMMLNQSSGTFTVPTADSHRCYMKDSSDHQTFTVIDALGPTAESPQDAGLVGQSTSLKYNTTAGPGPWFGPTSSKKVAWEAVDRGHDLAGAPYSPGGSGLNAITILFNGSDTTPPAGSSPYALYNQASICNAGSYGNNRPCPHSYNTVTGSVTLGNVGGLVTGSNTVRFTFWDFTDRSVVTGISKFRYDETLPTATLQQFDWDTMGFGSVPTLQGTTLVDQYGDGVRPHFRVSMDDVGSGLNSWALTYNGPGTLDGTICSASSLGGVYDLVHGEDYWECDWNQAGLTQGVYVLSLTATDLVGNQRVTSASVGLDLNVPNVPSISATQASNGNVLLSWSGTDNGTQTSPASVSGIARYEVCYGPSTTHCNDPANYVSKALTSSMSKWLTPRTWHARVKSVDNVGRYTYSTQATIVVDPVAPNAPGAPVLSQVQGELVNGTWVPSGTTVSGSQIVGYEVCIGVTSTYCDSAANFSSWQAPGPLINLELSAGTWWARVKAVDEFGLRSVASGLSASLTVDGTPPSVALDPVTPSVRADATIALTATAADSSGVEQVEFQRRDEGSASWATVGVDTSSAYEGSLATSTAFGADGLHQVRAVATDDPHGNAGASATQSVCVDRANLGQPSDVKHRLLGSPVTGAEVWWTAPATATGVAGYLVERRDDSTSPWSVIARVPKSVTSISDAASTTTTEYRVESIGRLCSTIARGDGSASSADSGGAAAQSPTNNPRVGTEAHWTMSTEALGGGALASVNLAGGNLMVEKALPSSSGRVFDTSPVLTYNSQDQTSHGDRLARGGVLGERWTLGLSDLAPSDGVTSFTGISTEPLVATSTTVTLRDDDGTGHVFDDATGGVFDAPPGTYLYVRDISVTAETAPSWATGATFAATRPDRVTFWYAGVDPMALPAADGRLLGVSDRNGARMLLQYECVEHDPASGDVNSLAAATCSTETAQSGYQLAHRLSKVLDAENRELVLAYRDETATSTDRDVEGRLHSITDHAGITHVVEYDRVGGDLASIPRVAAIVEADTTSAERATAFEYGLADSADTRWLDESTLITGVVDPRGSRTLVRHGALDGEQLPRVLSIVDRVDEAGDQDETRFVATLDDGVLTGSTAVLDESGHGETYQWDGQGRVVRSISAEGVTTRHEYTAGHRLAATHSVLAEDEQVTLSGTTSVALAETSIVDGTEVVVRSAPDQAGDRFEQGVDYVLTTSPASITRTASSTIPTGTDVYVTYIHASSAFTWDGATGLQLSARSAAPQRVGSGGVRVAPTAGEMAPATTTTYTNVALAGHVADVHTVTTPRGTATTGDADDFMTTTTYDGSLRVASVSTPINQGSGDAADLATQSFDYYIDGTLKSQTDAKDNTTGFSSYDASGSPQITHAITAGTFDPQTTAVETVTIYDARGAATCVDDKRETGDSASSPLATNACEFGSTNKAFDTTTYDALGRATVTTAAWDQTRRRATTTTFDPNDNVVATRASIGYTPGTSTPANPDSATPGAETTSTYDRLDRTTSVSLPANSDPAVARTSKTFYDVADRVIRDVQPQGVATENKVDYTTWSSYDKDGRPVRSMNGAGEVSCTWYDRLGRAYKQSQPEAVAQDAACPSSPPSSWVRTSEFDRAGNAIAVTDVTGRVTETYYDDEGNALRLEDATGAATSIASDPGGAELSITAPAFTACTDATTCSSTATVAPTVSMTYDKEGNLVTETSAREAAEGAAAGTHTTEYVVNAYDEVTRTDLPGGSFQHVERDAQGNIVATSIATDAASTGAVDANEKAAWQTAPDGSIVGKDDAATGTEYEAAYDVNGQLQSKTEHGVTTTWSYWPDGSLKTQSTRKLNFPWEASRTYAAGECVRPTTGGAHTYLVTTAGQSGTTEPTWPSSGSVTSGGATFAEHDCIETVEYTYDRNGQKLSVRQQTGSKVLEEKVLRRDNTGRELQTLGFNDPGTTADDEKASTTFAYDRNGTVVSRINNLRKTTYAYGETGVTTGLQVRTSIGYVGADPELSAAFAYDAAGRLASIIRVGTSKVVRTDMAYDAAGNMTRMATCGRTGETATCLDTNGALPSTVTDVYQDNTYEHDAEGKIRVLGEELKQADASRFAFSTSYAVGAVVTPKAALNGHQYIVTAAGVSHASAEPVWPTSSGGTVTSGTASFKEFTTTSKFAYDEQGRLVIEDRPDDPTTATGDFTRGYDYDANGRLDQVVNADCTSGAAVAEQYSYDEAGETSQVTERVENAFTAASGACTAATVETDAVTFGADGSSQEGAMTQVETTTSTGTDTVSYEHAADNTLAAVTDAAGDTTVVSRDAEDRPVAETEPGSGTSVETSDLTYAGSDRDAATVAEVGDVEARGVLEAPNGWLIAEHRDPEGYDRYFVTDHLGTPVQELDRSGVVKGTEDYDAYGADTALLASGQMTTTVAFAGERRDAETGLSDHDARSYDAELRTWVTTDQYEDPWSDLDLALDPLNAGRIAYAGGDPINYTDPSGHRVFYSTNNAHDIARVQASRGGYWAAGGSGYHTTASAAVTAARKAAAAKERARQERIRAARRKEAETLRRARNAMYKKAITMRSQGMYGAAAILYKQLGMKAEANAAQHRHNVQSRQMYLQRMQRIQDANRPRGDSCGSGCWIGQSATIASSMLTASQGYAHTLHRVGAGVGYGQATSVLGKVAAPLNAVSGCSAGYQAGGRAGCAAVAGATVTAGVGCGLAGGFTGIVTGTVCAAGAQSAATATVRDPMGAYCNVWAGRLSACNRR